MTCSPKYILDCIYRTAFIGKYLLELYYPTTLLEINISILCANKSWFMKVREGLYSG